MRQCELPALRRFASREAELMWVCQSIGEPKAERGYRDPLLLAIHNLLDNALKFTRDDDRLEIRAFEDGISVVVDVADTGPGIPDEELPHIFEELCRGQGARGVDRSGLWLSPVKAVVEQHGGYAAVRSRPGQGTVLTLRLPVSS